MIVYSKGRDVEKVYAKVKQPKIRPPLHMQEIRVTVSVKEYLGKIKNLNQFSDKC